MGALDNGAWTQRVNRPYCCHMNPWQMSRRVFLRALPLIIALSSCGSLAPAPERSPGPGLWSLDYTGGCKGRESERLIVTRLDDATIAFGDFRLQHNGSGQYSGAANFTAPMPVDGRDIPYTISYTLAASDSGGFRGTQGVIEGGGHGLDCPVELRYLGEA